MRNRRVKPEPARAATTFLRVDGDRSKNVAVINNDFGNVATALKQAPDVARGAVFVGSNRPKGDSE